MMFKRSYAFLCIATLLGLSGCHSLQAQQSVEALLEASSTTSRETLEKRIGNFYSSQPVKLADDVFTVSSTVFIERAKGNDSLPIIQRELPPVDSFTLLLQNNQCVLRHDQSKTILPLATIACKTN